MLYSPAPEACLGEEALPDKDSIMRQAFMDRACTFLVPIFLLAATLPAANYTLAVDASKTLGAMPRFWQEGVGSCHIYMVLNSAQNINMKEHFRMAVQELGMKRIRAHGILNDDVGIYREVNGVPAYNWTRLDSIYDFLVSIKMDPVIEMSFMPRDLASGNATFGWYGGLPGNISPPKDYAKWQELNYQFAKHLVDRYGAAKVATWHFEIWNEPDLGQFFSGTKDQYFRMYDHAVEGITKALPEAKVGGPSIAISGGPWIDDFLEHCMTQNFANAAKGKVKVDFITWHTYPTNSGQASIAGSHSGVHAKIAAKKAKYPALSHVKNFLTEFNTSYQGGNSFNNEIGASFVPKVVHGMFPDQNNNTPPPDMAAYWVISDLWEEWDSRSSLAFGPMGMVMRKHNVRKPNYLAYQMMARMGDTLLPLTGGTKAEPGLNGWATIDRANQKIHLLIYDHNRGNGDDVPQAYLDKVTLTLSNIPIAFGKLGLTRFAVDRNQANAFRIWERGGKPAMPSEALWTEMSNAARLTPKTDGFKATQNGATLTLEFDQYQPGVTLFEIQGESPVGLGGIPAPASGIPTAKAVVTPEGVRLLGIPSGVAAVSIADLQGRVLRTLEAKGQDLLWDRHDASGAKARPGAYLVVFSGPGAWDKRLLTLPD